MIKVSDYVAKRLVEHNVTDLFMISGGGAMHLNDSIGKNSQLNYHCCHHEQALAIAAEGYARSSGKMGVVNVTTGPGGTNTMTGVIGQWLDSVPVLYISGQVKFATTVHSCPEVGLRQLGDQEIDIVSIVSPVTKFATMVRDPLDIKKAIDEAVYTAKSGRPGPTWVDIPLDVQGAMINEAELREFVIPEEKKLEVSSSTLDQVVAALQDAKRPLIVAGHGVRLADAVDDLLTLLDKSAIPVVTTFNGLDLVPTSHSQFVGRIGTLGTRPGNFALQNADCILFLGTRNNIRQTSYNWENFAQRAKKIVVEVDAAELNKPNLVPDIPIHVDVKDFMQAILPRISKSCDDAWLEWCQERKHKYPVVEPHYKEDFGMVQPYWFIDELTKSLPAESVIVAGNGTACVALFQAANIQHGQRVFYNSGCASMGYDLPAALGAAVANPDKPVVCLAGDGSLMMNLQELQTMLQWDLPIKLFILNNGGYISIKQTQRNFFSGRMVACDAETGVGFPDFVRLAEAFDLPARIISDQKNLQEQIEEVLQLDGPVVCEIQLQKDYIFSPKVSSQKLPDGKIVSKPLDHMAPFLDEEEYAANIIEE